MPLQYTTALPYLTQDLPPMLGLSWYVATATIAWSATISAWSGIFNSLSLSLFVRVCDYSVLIESFSESLCVWGCSVLIFVFFCFEPLTNWSSLSTCLCYLCNNVCIFLYKVFDLWVFVFCTLNEFMTSEWELLLAMWVG